MKRPFCICIGAYFLFSYLVLTIGKDLVKVALPILCIITALLLLLLIILKKRTLVLLFLVCLFSLLSIFKNSFIDLEKITLAKDLHEETVTVDGGVKTYNKDEKFVSFTVEDKNLNARIKVYCYDTDLDVDVGKRASFTGELTFDSDSYYKGEETFLTCFVNNVDVYESDNFLDRLIVKLRSHVRSSVSGTENQGLMKALIIGDKSDISDEVTDNFKKLGTSHVLAISGLHLSIAVMSLYLFLVRIGASRRLSSFVSIVAAFLYMAVTGFSVSVVRAGQMMIIYLFTRMLRRVNDSITGLFTAGFLIMLNSSWTVFSLSFRLSFLSTLGILIFLPYVSRQLDKMHFIYIKEKGYPNLLTRVGFKFVDYVVISLYSTMAATLFTLPVIILSFNEISLISPLANLLIVFFVKYLLVTAFLGSIFSFIPPLSAVMLIVSNFVCNAMLTVAKILASFAPAFFGVDMGFIGWGALLCVLLTLPSLFFSRKVLTLPITAVVIALALGIFNFTVEKATFNHVRVSSVWQRGCNSIFVSSCGKNYFLDLTASTSEKVSPLIALTEKRRINSIDEAVLVFTSGFPEERVELILDVLKPAKLTFIIAGEFDGEYYRIYEKCRETATEINTVYSSVYSVDDNVTFSYRPETCTVFKIEKEDKAMTFYKPITSQEVALYLLDSDVVFFGARKAPLENAYTIDELPLSFWRITENKIIRE